MIEVIKTFSLDDIELFKEDDDVDFAEVKLYALADGNNTHKNPIKPETLKKYGNTILGKFIIGKYSSIVGDVTTHVPSQSILGYVPKDQEVKYEEKDGKTFITVMGLLSKLYATDVVTMFKKDNFRNVSCEFSCIEDDEDSDGNKEILSFTIHGITILGLRYQPSCAGAEIKVMKFSEKESDPLKKFAEDRRKSMADTKSYKINKTELKETPWGDVDKTSMRNKIMEASNKDSLVHSVYLLIEDGWEDSPSQDLKYPVMELVGDTFYYNRDAFGSALGYAKSESEDEVISKLKKLYKKFKLDFPEDDSERKEKKMSQEEDKKFEIEGREAWGDVIKKVEDHEGKGVYVQSVEKDHIIFKKDDVVYRVSADVKAGKDDKTVSATIDWDTVKKDKVQKDFSAVDLGNLWCKVYDCLEDRYPSGKEWGGSIYCIVGIFEEDNKKFAIINRKGEEVLYRLDIDITEDGLTISDEIKKVEQTFTVTDEVKKFSKYFEKMKKEKFEDGDNDDEDDEDEDKELSKKKKMSLDSHADAGAMLEMLEKETKDNEELSKMVSEMKTFEDENIIMEKFVEHFCKMAKEKDELREFKVKTEAKDTEAMFNKTMADVKGDIEEKEYAKLYAEGESIKSKEDMKEFSVRVKAFAYESAKTPNEFRYAGSGTQNKKFESTNVWDIIRKK